MRSRFFILALILQISLSSFPVPTLAQSSSDQMSLQQMASLISSLQSILNSLKAKVSALTGGGAVQTAQAQTADITTGLVGHWKFDEGSGTSASDSSGNNNTGTLTNGPTWTAGKVGSAISIGGSSYVSVSSVFDVSALPFTLSTWVNPANFNDYSTLIGKRTTYSTNGMRFNLDLYPGSGIVFLQSASSELSFSYAPPLNQWTLLSVVVRSGATDLYVNGSLQQTIGGFTLGTGSTAQMRMGNAADGPDQYAGSLDDIRIYNRALAASDISTLYSLGSGTVPPSPSQPTNLSATAVSSSQINLSWSASIDNVGVTGYRVERCQGVSCTTFTQISTPTGTTYNDTGLAVNTTYRYQVRAVDAATNLSSYSTIVTATTQTAPAGGSYTRVFYDNFEDGTTNKWEQDPPHPKCLAISAAHDNGVPYAGTKMAECNWDSNGYSGLMLGSWSYNTEFLVRAWVRTDADVDRVVGSKWFRLANSAGIFGSNSIYWDGQMETPGGPMISVLEWLDGNPVTIVKYSGPNIGDGQWHKIELYVKAGTNGSAIFRFWADDILQHEITGQSSVPANKYFPAYVVSNWSQCDPCHDANNHIYWDNFEIYSDATTGTGATGNLSDATIQVVGTLPSTDTTAPTTPAGLSATAISASQINLSWTASTDSVWVTGYRVESCQGASCTNFTQIGTPVGTTFSNTGLFANTVYRYRVRAADAAGNLSGYSSIASATTQAGASGYTRVFFDDFESGNTNLWQQNDVLSPKCPVVTSALDGGPDLHAGTHMAQCNWNGGSYDALALNSWNYATEMLIRFWIRADNDVDHVMGSKIWRIGSSKNSIGAIQFEHGDIAPLYMNWFDSNSNQLAPVYWPNPGNSPALGNHQWHKIELYFKSGAGNGIIRTWIDGAQVYNATSVTSETWYPFFLMSNWSMNPGWEHDANNHIYWDDFEIYSDATTGTTATGNLSDGSVVAGGVPATLIGDLNLDRIVNSLDWSLMNAAWSTNNATADLNRDGIVNSLDFSLMNANWGRTS